MEAADQSQTNDMKKYALSLIVQHLPEVSKQSRFNNLSRELCLDILHALAEDRQIAERGDMVSFVTTPD